MRGPAIALAMIVTACAEPAIELRFDTPTANELPTGFDLSCVTSVGIVAVANERDTPDGEPDDQGACIDLPRAPSSFADITSMLQGQIDIPLPESGLGAIAIAGFVGPCDGGPYHETVFYGGATFADGEAITVPIETNVSCAGKDTAYTVHTVDLLALASTGTCSSPPAQLFPATIRPLMLGSEFPLMTFEFGTDVAESSTGVASLTSFASAGPRSCLAFGASGVGDVGYGGGACTNAPAKSLCGGANEHEVATVPFSFSDNSRDPALLDQYGEPIMGAVFAKPADPAAPKLPLAGATITVAGDAANSRVVYAAPDATVTQLVPTGTSATNASGWFLVYLKGTPTQITVSAPGHASQTFTVASSLDWPATLAVGLAPL